MLAELTGRITGTFLDEITIDIGSHNWSADDWRICFDAMAFIGIDTVIIIRGGLRDQAVFPSEVVGNAHDPDLAQLFLDEASERQMRLFFGTYDTCQFYHQGEAALDEEIRLGRAFAEEVVHRYQGHPAWCGWYITHEFSANQPGVNRLFRETAVHLKTLCPSHRCLISPFYPTVLTGREENMTPGKFLASWQEALDGTRGLIDIVAFQDGTAPAENYEGYLQAVQALGQSCGVEIWNNVETFDRHMSYRFPPRDYRVLLRRLMRANPYVTKHITFEFSHFMSPNSEFPGAANLYRRYCETILGVPSPF